MITKAATIGRIRRCFGRASRDFELVSVRPGDICLSFALIAATVTVQLRPVLKDRLQYVACLGGSQCTIGENLRQVFLRVLHYGKDELVIAESAAANLKQPD